MITLMRYRLRPPARIWRRRPDKEVNEMFASLVNQGCYWPVVQIVETATDQGKTRIRKIDNRGRKIEPRIQPRFHSVLVGGSDVRKVVCHQRTHMTGNKLRRQELLSPWSLQARQQVPTYDRCDNNGRCKCQPIPLSSEENNPWLWPLPRKQRISR